MTQIRVILQLFFLSLFSFCAVAIAQEPALPTNQAIKSIEINQDARIKVPQSIQDASIQKRIQEIMTITPWFGDTTIKVTYGVAVLSGSIERLEHKQWLLDVLKKTDGVIAWVDQLDVHKVSIDDLTPNF